MHGIIDEAGLEFGVYSGSSNHANLSDASERKSTHTIWSDEGTQMSHAMRLFLHLIINFRFSLFLRVNIVWHEPNKALNLWSKFTKKMVRNTDDLLIASSSLTLTYVLLFYVGWFTPPKEDG
jgi:hypothetical protein